MRNDDVGRAIIERENNRIDEKCRLWMEDNAEPVADGMQAGPAERPAEDVEMEEVAGENAQEEMDTEMISHMKQVSREVHMAEIYSPPE